MIQGERRKSDERRRADEIPISRRVAIGASAAVVLGAMSGGSSGQEGGSSGLPKEIQERMAKSRAFSLRMRDAATEEERKQIMAERSVWEQARALENIRKQLETSAEEWKVIKPRIEAIYNLQHPPTSSRPGNETKRTEVQQKSVELSELLRDKAAAPDQIKARLTALRSAQEKARQELATAQQNLRQILTLRQEALLVLNGLLD